MASRRTPEIHRASYRELLKRLVLAREEAGLTQPDVAERINRSRSHVSKVETGERRLTFLDVVEFAMLYDKPIEWFAPPRAMMLRETPGLKPGASKKNN